MRQVEQVSIDLIQFHKPFNQKIRFLQPYFIQGYEIRKDFVVDCSCVPFGHKYTMGAALYALLEPSFGKVKAKKEYLRYLKKINAPLWKRLTVKMLG
jgi:hypothetical protein